MKSILTLALRIVTAHAAPFLQPTNPTPVVTLQWTPAQGSVTSKLYWGTASGQYTNAVTVTNAALPGPTTATVSLATKGIAYYFAATDVSSNGLESAFSTNEVTYTPMLPPAPPTMGTPLIVTVQTKTSPLDFMWTDLFNESIDPGNTNGMFRLQIAQSSGNSGQLKQVKRTTVPPPPLPK